MPSMAESEVPWVYENAEAITPTEIDYFSKTPVGAKRIDSHWPMALAGCLYVIGSKSRTLKGIFRFLQKLKISQTTPIANTTQVPGSLFTDIQPLQIGKQMVSMNRSKRSLILLIILTILATTTTSLLVDLVLPDHLPGSVNALLSGLIATLITIAVVQWRIIRPLTDFSQRLSRCNDRQASSLGQLEDYDNKQFVSDIAASIQRNFTRFDDLGQNLSECGGNISIADAEVSHFIDQLKKKIEGDVREITEIASSANQLAQASGQAADSATIAAEAVTETRNESCGFHCVLP